MGAFSRDQLRVIVCFAGIFGLFFQLVAETVFGASIGAGLTGTFGTLATLPFVDSAVEKFSSKRGPSDPDDPPSSQLPTSPEIQQPTEPQQSAPHPERSDVSLLVVAA